MKELTVITCVLVMLVSCRQSPTKLFTRLEGDDSGIRFTNQLKETADANVLNYSYFYNGGGVAVGDINNDGLPDLLFTGNMVPNRLYLNKTDSSAEHPEILFEDITSLSGIAAEQGWCTGATMVDINNDGWLDIYICRSADAVAVKRKNLLYINEKNLRFSEQAVDFGLADLGYSSQAAFFDADRDGDLDMFLINHSLQEYANEGLENPSIRNKKHPEYASKLYINDNGYFRDQSEAAGIVSNVLSFGLGIAVSDFNQDGWPDIYVSNDFNEPDYLFINKRDGTFSEQMASSMDEISLYSMGSDAADYNNDGYTDLLTLDMLQEDAPSQKMHVGAENFDKFQLLYHNGLYYQNSRNMLHTNNGDGSFSETGQLAGISATDWSWAGLFCDLDNDGLKDLLVTNGYARDYTDMDFVRYSMGRAAKLRAGQKDEAVLEYISNMPAIIKENCLFRNKGGLQFEKINSSWGLQEKGISSGAAYADLDLDGDLDLIINNLNEQAAVYRNNLNEISPSQGYLKIKLDGPPGNRLGIGSKITLHCGNQLYYQEQYPVRGFQSSVDPVLNIGTGAHKQIDSLVIEWPDGRREALYEVTVRQLITINWKETLDKEETGVEKEARGAEPVFKVDSSWVIEHHENPHNDFTLQTLLPHYLSRRGPVLRKADVNGDGLEDLFMGGAAGAEAILLLQQKDGSFKSLPQPDFKKDAPSEDVDAVFFDADQDGDQDLYVCSGAYEISDSLLLADRLYLNDGKGRFLRGAGTGISSGTAAAYDVNQDGKTDLFTAGRVLSGKYPLSGAGHLLINRGGARFEDRTEKMAPALRDPGMVRAAAWAKIGTGGGKVLVLAGEWTLIQLYQFRNGKLQNITKEKIGFESSGWWNCILAEDLDGDGDEDLVLGNRGLNTLFHVNEKEPITLHYSDFDKNGSIDPILCYYSNGVAYPAATRDDLTEQLPGLKKKFLEYKAYSTATLNAILTEPQLKAAGSLSAITMETIFLENRGDSLVRKQLPIQAQIAPVFALESIDYDKDGIADLVLAGNDSWSRIRFGRNRANHGILLKGLGNGNFEYIPPYKSGLNIRGNTRSLLPLRTAAGNLLIFGVNDDKAAIYKW